MVIRIAAISSNEFISQIIKFEKKIPNIKIIPYIYENPLESDVLIDQIFDCDVLLFAGPLPYFIAKEKIEQKNLPAVYIPSDEYTLTQTLFFTLINRPEGLHQLSIDIHNEEYINQVTEELNLEPSEWFIMDFKQKITEDYVDLDAEEIIRFHKERWENNQSKFALTSVDYVYTRLKQLGIPCSAMIVPDKAIVDAIHKAITYGQLAISKNSEIAIGMVVFNQEEDLSYDFGSLKQDATIVLQQILLELVKETETTIRLIGMDQFIIYGTRRSIEQMVDKEHLRPFLQKIDLFYDITVSMGFGYGLTAKEAEGNARIALFHAKKDPKVNNVFIATAEKEIIGPLNADAKTYQLKSESKKALEIAEKTQISVATVTKLLQFLKLRRDSGFTAVDFAEYLEISRRSAERMIKKLADQKYAEKVGEEQPYQHGRPRAVYRLNFD